MLNSYQGIIEKHVNKQFETFQAVEYKEDPDTTDDTYHTVKYYINYYDEPENKWRDTMTVQIRQPKEGSYKRPDVVYVDDPWQWSNGA